MFKTFQSKFSLICEEDISRFRQGGFENGDYVKILPTALKHPKLQGHGSQFFDRIREMVANKYPTKISAIKSERAESSNGLMGSADAPTNFWADVVQEPAPGLFVNVITLPTDVLEVVTPSGNNFSPDLPDEWKYDAKVQIKPLKVKPLKATDETEKQTSGSKRELPTKNNKDVQGKEAKDGRDGLKKPKKYKEAFENDNDMLTEAYASVHQEAKPAPYVDKPLTIDNKDVLTLTEAYNKVHPSPFNEITVTIPWEYIDDAKNIYEYGEAEIMVHVADLASPDRIIRAYAYVKDVKGMPRKWLGRPSRNALFINLSNQFIQDHKPEIDEAVSDSLAEDEQHHLKPPSQEPNSTSGQPIGGKL